MPRSKKAEPTTEPPIQPWLSINSSAPAITFLSTLSSARAGGPVTMKVGGRTLISVEAAAAWRRDRELAAQEARHQRETDSAEDLTQESRPGREAAFLLFPTGQTIGNYQWSHPSPVPRPSTGVMERPA
jgi:hypothetical protein